MQNSPPALQVSDYKCLPRSSQIKEHCPFPPLFLFPCFLIFPPLPPLPVCFFFFCILYASSKISALWKGRLELIHCFIICDLKGARHITDAQLSLLNGSDSSWSRVVIIAYVLECSLHIHCGLGCCWALSHTLISCLPSLQSWWEGALVSLFCFP